MLKPQTMLDRISQMATSAVRTQRLRADDPADDPADDDADDQDDDEGEPDPAKKKKAKPKKADDDDTDDEAARRRAQYEAGVAATRHVGPAAAAILRAGATRRVPLGDGDKFIVNPAPQQTKGVVRDPTALAKLIVNSAKKARGEIT